MQFFVKSKQSVFHDSVFLQASEQVCRIDAKFGCGVFNGSNRKVRLSVIKVLCCTINGHNVK